MPRKQCLLAVTVCVLAALIGGVMAVGLPAERDPVEAVLGLAITVEPATPTVADVITITVEGELPVPCFDISSSHSRAGNVIEITVDAVRFGEACAFVITSFSVAEEIGRLPAGAYEVVATAYKPFPFSCIHSPCSVGTTFEVASFPIGSVDLCHIPPGDPDNARTLSVNGSALDRHLAHGDAEGDCP